MKVIYELDKTDFAELTFETKLISKRQDLVLTPGRLQRRDMFWVEVRHYAGELGAVAIEPDYKDPTQFRVNKNWNGVCDKQFGQVSRSIYAWFKDQPEYQQQIEWVQAIIDKNYTPTQKKDHVPEEHTDCKDPYCPICQGGLFVCKVCGLTEGSLTTECPGRESWVEYGDAVYTGKADFINGEWVEQASPHSPEFFDIV